MVLGLSLSKPVHFCHSVTFENGEKMCKSGRVAGGRVGQSLGLQNIIP
jgi:hypothetical protein